MRAPGFSEDHVEQAAIETLKRLGWLHLDGIAISPDSAAPQRASFADTVLTRRFDQAVRAINPDLPDEAIESAMRQVLNTDKPNLIEENRRLHMLVTDGVGVEYRADDGSVKNDRVWLVDFDNIEANDWLATNQFTVVEGQRNRRPDLVCFLNGLPVAVVELKNPGSESATLTSAYNQLRRNGSPHRLAHGE